MSISNKTRPDFHKKCFKKQRQPTYKLPFSPDTITQAFSGAKQRLYEECKRLLSVVNWRFTTWYSLPLVKFNLTFQTSTACRRKQHGISKRHAIPKRHAIRTIFSVKMPMDSQLQLIKLKQCYPYRVGFWQVNNRKNSA